MSLEDNCPFVPLQYGRFEDHSPSWQVIELFPSKMKPLLHEKKTCALWKNWSPLLAPFRGIPGSLHFSIPTVKKKRQKKKNGKHRENLLTLEMAFERAYSHQLERTPSSIELSVCFLPIVMAENVSIYRVKLTKSTCTTTKELCFRD